MTVRVPILFMAAACSSASPSPQLPAPAPISDAQPVDASADAASPALGVRGERCPCEDDLTCTGLPGGYCAAASCASCDGACVDTARFGELCAASCTSDRECRVDEGYVCDPTWRACLVPNVAVIVPKQCASVAHDAAFVEQWTRDGIEPSAVLDPAGNVIAASLRPLARDSKLVYGTWAAEGHVLVASSSDGIRWTDPVMVDDGERPFLVMGDALYLLYGNDGLRVRASRDGGKTFGESETRTVGTYGNAVWAGGALHIVTINGNVRGAFGSAHQTIEYTSGAQPVVVSGRDELLPFYFANPSIAVDRKTIYIAYVRGGRDAVWELVLATSKDGGATWKRKVVAGGNCQIHMVPNIAIDNGTVHLAYYEGNPGNFVHAQCAAKCKVTGAINAAPFTLSTARSAPKFVGDRAALLVDSKRRKLHALWTEPGGKIHYSTAKISR
jgi:hypothetical protein